MRIKLDENLGLRGTERLRAEGHDVSTVAAQDLCSIADDTLVEICRIEKRVLISLDTDFANTLRFRPLRYAGLVVLRLPEPLARQDIEHALTRFATLARTRDVTGRLWIIDQRRIREYDEGDGP